MEAGQGLRRVPQQPEGLRGIESAGHTRILTYAEHQRMALGWRVACDGFLQLVAGSRQRTKPQPRYPKGIVGDDHERGVVGLLGQAQQGFPNLTCPVQLRPSNIKPPKTEKDHNKLWRLAHVLTQRVGLGVGVLHLGGRLPFRHLQGRTEGDVQG